MPWVSRGRKRRQSGCSLSRVADKSSNLIQIEARGVQRGAGMMPAHCFWGFAGGITHFAHRRPVTGENTCAPEPQHLAAADRRGRLWGPCETGSAQRLQTKVVPP